MTKEITEMIDVVLELKLEMGLSTKEALEIVEDWKREDRRANKWS